MRRISLLPKLFSVALMSAITLTLASCDQSINPLVGEDRPFTLWGYLDASADTQRVRVFSIDDRLGTDRSGPIDAEVTTMDLTTGETIRWTDEVVTFINSSVGHVFYAVFRAEYEHSYRLVVRRSDGATSTAEVSIPPKVRVQLVDARNRIVVPILIHGKLPKLVDLHVEYDAATQPPANPWPPGSVPVPSIHFPVLVFYDNMADSRPDGWYLEVNLRSDFEIVRDTYALNCLSPDHIALRRVRFRFLATDDQWDPPLGSFDPNLLIEPGTFSNVDNGYGFFGGGYSVAESWVPSEVVQRAEAPCLLQPVNIPECQLPPEPCFK